MCQMLYNVLVMTITLETVLVELISFRSEEHTSELPVTDVSRMPSSA